MKAKTQKKAKVKAKKRTLTQRVARLEKSLRTSRIESGTAMHHCMHLAQHVGRLLREKETLMATREVPQELQR